MKFFSFRKKKPKPEKKKDKEKEVADYHGTYAEFVMDVSDDEK